MILLTWIESHTGLFQALAAILLTMITGVYVVLTWRLLKENQKFRVASSRPNVIAYLIPHEAHINLVYLVIENVGLGAAYDLRLACSGNTGVLDAQLTDLGLFRRGLTVLSPGGRRDVFIANAIGKFDQLKQAGLAVSVQYRSPDEHEYEESFELDFSQYEHFSQVGKPPTYKLADELERLRKTAEAWSTSGKRLQVKTFSPEDIAREASVLTLLHKLTRLNSEDRKRVETFVDSIPNADNEKGKPYRDKEMEG